MGSTYVVKLEGSNYGEAKLLTLRREVDAALVEVNRQMSHYQPDSELSRFNASTSTAPVRVSTDFAELTRFTLALNRRSGGAFDPTLGPVVNLWGFGEQGEVLRVPSPERIEQARMQTGTRYLHITASNQLQKDLPTLHLNLSAVAKGFGVDVMARVLFSRGESNFLVQISGETYAAGRKANGDKWRIGIDTPKPGLATGESLEAVVEMSDQALSTSGDYRKFIKGPDGRRFSHIFDPATGHPVTNNLGSVTVLATNCATADALSTTLFVMGAERGLKWIDEQPGASALFIVRKDDGTFDLRGSAKFPPVESRPKP